MSAIRLKTRSPRSLSLKGRAQAHPFAVAAVTTVGALAISAVVNRRLARDAEHDNPPAGRFLEVSGVRLHYVERGSGTPLVLLHGNGSMIQDFESSGLIDLAAKNYRVIVFDRPGFGHSDRPRNVVWTPAAQAELIYNALQRLGVSMRSSWGTRGVLRSQSPWRSDIRSWSTAWFLRPDIIIRLCVLTRLLYPPPRCLSWAMSCGTPFPQLWAD
jgi:alpha/beta hydrolase fold